jgi:hypothetical protein
MKKWLTGFCVLLLVSVALEYLFIPGNLIVVKIVPVQCNVNSANKFLGLENNWAKWWTDRRGGDSAGGGPGIDSVGEGGGSGSFRYGGMGFRMARQFQHVMEVTIKLPDTEIPSRITIVGSGNNIDSTILKWDCSLDAGLNPIRRIRQYQVAKQIKANMEGILFALRSFLENKVKVYGLSISEGSTKDSFLVGIKSVYRYPPATADIYILVNRLKKFMARSEARETDHPMLNVISLPQGYQVSLAIPEDKNLPATGDIFTQKLVPGRYLVTDVAGGEYAVKTALAGLQNYVTDYQRTSMAIPFQLLITDRSLERDTAKWVTRIYYPVY